jgi:surface polysaccharide O-acyltransferase-like enzyme
MSVESAAVQLRPPTKRIVFLDLARAGAVLFMIQGHTIHQLLNPVYEDTPVFQAWLFLRGLTSCMFLLLSGFAFSVASDKYWDDLKRPSIRLWRRLVRFTFFLGLGYLIHFPMGRFAHLKFADAERWQSFLQVDVLQVVAVSLILLQALSTLLATRRQFAMASAATGGLIVLATPFFWSRSWAGDVPLWLASYLSSETGSNFPLFSWGAFLFLGAALGMAYTQRRAGRALDRTSVAFAGLGGILTVAGLVAFHLPINPFDVIDPWRAGPAIFTIRLGCVLLLLSGFVYVGRFIERLPQYVNALSQESLTIYVVHVAALYGSLWAPGLGELLGRQGLLSTFAWIAALFASMAVLAWMWNWTKRHRPQLTWALRLAIAAGLIWPLL